MSMLPMMVILSEGLSFGGRLVSADVQGAAFFSRSPLVFKTLFENACELE